MDSFGVIGLLIIIVISIWSGYRVGHNDGKRAGMKRMYPEGVRDGRAKERDDLNDVLWSMIVKSQISNTKADI
jgi:hypothetical protein